MTVQVRAKFKCMNIKHGYVPKDAKNCAVTVEMIPVWTGEDGVNKKWSQATPSGKLEMLITEPKAAEVFELGRDYYLDFVPAED